MGTGQGPRQVLVSFRYVDLGLFASLVSLSDIEPTILARLLRCSA